MNRNNPSGIFLANVLVFILKMVSEKNLYSFSKEFKAEVVDFCESQFQPTED